MSLAERREKLKKNKMKSNMVIDLKDHSRNIEKFAQNFDTHLKDLHASLNEELFIVFTLGIIYRILT